MPYLIAVSLLWAFSFGIIKVGLSDLDSTAVATVRLGQALMVLLPFFRPQQTPRIAAIRFMAIGAVQFGLMYAFYIAAFRHLQAHEVAMFTIFTPIYIVLLDGAIERRLDRRALLAAFIALAGAAILKWRSGISDAALIGFLLMQGSNLCFSIGQIAYQRQRLRWHKFTDAALFAWLYLGAVITAGVISLIITDWSSFQPSTAQWGALIYLGIIASGLGFFGWNIGVTKVKAGTLAVFNNLVIPLAVIVSLVAFGESADIPRLGLSVVLMLGALYLAESSRPVRS